MGITNYLGYETSPLRVVAMVFIILVFSAFWGCGKSTNTKPPVSKSSVSGLLAALPNLKSLGIESCSYTFEKSTARSLVPSSSDVKVTVRGSAQLSEEGFKTLRSRFEWKPISRSDVPESLLAIVPAGDILYSQKFNESFDDNPINSYTNGFVVILTGGDSRSIFLLSTDIDHPIK